MPRRDGTGPMGYGPLSGRGFGPCSNRDSAPGRVFGRGFGWRYTQGYQPVQQVNLNREEEKRILEAELKNIEAEKQEIERKLKELS